VFFVLYLCAVAVFVFASRQRDRLEEELSFKGEQLALSLIPPLEATTPDSAAFHYVDAHADGTVSSSDRYFFSMLYFHDIGPEDSVEVKVYSVTHDNVLVAPSCVEVHDRRGIGALGDRTVGFPLRCSFDRTGVWSVVLEARSVRLHPEGDTLYRKQGRAISSDLMPKKVLNLIESAKARLIVTVMDTSIPVRRDWTRLNVSVAMPTLEGPAGAELENRLIVDHALETPAFRLVRGYGKLSIEQQNISRTQFLWSGVAAGGTDTIEVEFRTTRQEAVLNVSRAFFVVRGVEPFLDQPIPKTAYAGEDLTCRISAAGLPDPAAYRWEITEVTGLSETASKVWGSGPLLRYHIPNNFAGKRLRLRATYANRPYKVICPVSYEMGTASFLIPVIDPPTRISVSLPSRPTISQAINFTVLQYSEPEFMYDRPLRRLKDVKVELWRLGGTEGFLTRDLIRTDVSMTGMGRFQITRSGETGVMKAPSRVQLIITAQEAKYEREFILFP